MHVLFVVFKLVHCSHLSVIIKFMFSKKATKMDEIFTVDLTVTTYGQIQDFFNFCGLLRKRELYRRVGCHKGMFINW